jgi:hypothetical protein
MADRVVEVTSQSWLGRIGGSIKGIFVGLLLAAAAVALLFWNEGRAVRRARTLAEGAGSVVSVPAAAVDPGREGRLVHTSGEATTSEVLRDPLFGVERNALVLERRVEMYQWVEESRSEERKKLGGGTETVTTYTYERRWEASPQDSTSFREPAGHDNPPFPFTGESWRAAEVRLGAFRLAPTVAAEVSRDEEHAVDEAALAAVDPGLREGLLVADGAFYRSAHPASPAVGDLRVTFRAVPPATVSVVAGQRRGELQPYQTAAGGELSLVTYGSVPAAEMFTAAERANTTLTWVLRLAGCVLLFAGVRTVLRPMVVLADVVPLFGRVVGMGVNLVALGVAAPVALLTIAVGWFFYRPWLAAGLLAAALAIAVWLWRRARRPTVMAMPAFVPPPPPAAPAS